MSNHELVRLLACVDAALFVAFVGAVWMGRRREERRRQRALADAKARKQKPLDRERSTSACRSLPPAPGSTCPDGDLVVWEDAVAVVLARYAAEAERLTTGMSPGEVEVIIRALVAAYRKSESER